jgi:hypothetical protein
MLIRNRSHRSHLLTRGACGRRHWEGQSTSAARVRSYDATRRRQARAGSRSLSRRLRGTPDVRLAARNVRRRAAHTSAAPRSTQSGRLAGRLESARSRAPLIGVKRPEIRFLHENSKNIPAGSNPSKRHLADRGIVVPSDQERKTRPTTGIPIKVVPGTWVHSDRAEGTGQAMSVGTELTWTYRRMDRRSTRLQPFCSREAWPFVVCSRHWADLRAPVRNPGTRRRSLTNDVVVFTERHRSG